MLLRPLFWPFIHMLTLTLAPDISSRKIRLTVVAADSLVKRDVVSRLRNMHK